MTTDQSMAPFDECSVLLPSATLDDFPTGGSDENARSLLAGWTVLWHPRLLAQTGQLPSWYRADSPPTPDGPRIVVIPDPSRDQIPADFRRRCEANPDCIWVTGADRDEMIAAIGIDGSEPDLAPLDFSGRTIAVEDFFAAGYLSLQIQIMTRRLRYTSNLDEVHLQSRITAAAKAFCERNAAEAAEGLHDVFDSLAEERDHYFSSDPYLIDLALLTPGVLDRAIDSGWLDRLSGEATPDQEDNGILGSARNVLVDGQLAQAIVSYRNDQPDGDRFDKFFSVLDQETVGWAGGGRPDASESCPDAMTIASARESLEQGYTLAKSAIGKDPVVFGQLAGVTPTDLVSSLSALGYRGVIPIDFAAGTGYGEESKVILSAGGVDLDALTAKPIDAASDAAFLSIGAHLGEAIDSGEIATALLVHWPDRVCESYRDLCRAASWSLALGRFWTLDRYFTDGERPYHSGSLEALSTHSANGIASRIAESDASLGSMAESFCAAVRRETHATTRSLAVLAKPELLESLPAPEDSAADDSAADDGETVDAICKLVGVTARSETATEAASDVLCFNPHGGSTREQTRLRGGGPSDQSFIYAATKSGDNLCDVTFDVPGFGFTKLSATAAIKTPGLWKRLTGGEKGIAEPGILKNEFMAVSLDEATGGVAGVYSASRGNRLSMRLVAVSGGSAEKDVGEMRCQQMRVVETGTVAGSIETQGTIYAKEGAAVADFVLRYRLQRGSRLLRIEGRLRPKPGRQKSGDAGFWNRYLAVRTAIAGEASIMRPIVRDKVHSCSSRRLVAPLGVVIDEAEKQTLVCGRGLPLHRRVGERFLDTPVAGLDAKDDELAFEIVYAFDAPKPVSIARSVLAPPVSVAIESTGKSDAATTQAWLMHVSAGEVLVTEVNAQRRADGLLALRMLLVQTRPKVSKVKLQFCTAAKAAFIEDRSGIERALDDLPDDVGCDDGIVSLSVGSHSAVDLVVVFDV